MVKLVSTNALTEGNSRKVEVKDIASGIYFIIGQASEGQMIQKIIVK